MEDDSAVILDYLKYSMTDKSSNLPQYGNKNVS